MRAVSLHQDPILLIPVRRRSEPQRALVAICVASCLEAGQESLNLPTAEQLALGKPVIEPDAELLEVRGLIFPQSFTGASRQLRDPLRLGESRQLLQIVLRFQPRC